MKQSLVMMVLLLITVAGLGKVALPFLLAPAEDAQAVADVSPVLAVEEVEHIVLQSNVLTQPLATIRPKKETSFYESWSGKWLMQELIPSVEAAESMPLAEEKRSSDKGSMKVTELRAMQRKLKAREKAVKEREAEAKNAESRAEDKILALEQLEVRIKDLLAQEKSIKDKKIKRLTAVYEGMKAEKAAPVIGQMNLAIVVKIFSRMSEKQVGKILSFLPPKKAVVISQALTERIGSMN